MSLLVAGGQTDPNLTVLIDAANKAGVAVVDLRLAADASPGFCWNLEENSVQLNGKALPVPRGAFFRHDVFISMQDPRPAVAARALAWTTAVFDGSTSSDSQGPGWGRSRACSRRAATR